MGQIWHTPKDKHNYDCVNYIYIYLSPQDLVFIFVNETKFVFTNMNTSISKIIFAIIQKQHLCEKLTNNTATLHLLSTQESKLFVYLLKFKKLSSDGINYRKCEVNMYQTRVGEALSIILSMTHCNWYVSDMCKI